MEHVTVMFRTEITRRRLLSGSAAAATLIGMPRIASAQSPIRFGTWGGGVGKLYQSAWLQPFTSEHGIAMELSEVAQPSEQIRVEAGRPQHHVLSVNQVDGVLLAREGMLTELDPDDYPELKNVNEDMWFKVDGKLYGLPPYAALYGIAVNTNRAKDTDFESWKALADPKWKGQLTIPTPVRAAQLEMTMMAVANGASPDNVQPGLDDFRKYVANTQVAYSSMAQMNQLLLRGNVAAGPYHFGRIWEMRMGGVTHVAMVPPVEGVLVNTYGIVVPKGIEVTPEIKKFLNYVASAAPQLRAFGHSGNFPVNNLAKIDMSEAQKGLGYSNSDLVIKRVVADPAMLAEQLRERTNIAEKIFAGI